tara:strand:- start:620 stop:1051 length:432 start_codon:yes stop_codon:yes gene_type:complete
MGLLKTSKVKNVQANGTWESKATGDTYYKFDIEMEDGNTGEYSSKSQDQNKFVVGEEVQYEYHGGKFPKIKPYYNKGNFTGGFKGNDDRQVSIIRQSSLKASIEYLRGAEASLEEVFETAEKMIAWVNKTEVNTDNKKDDLPF